MVEGCLANPAKNTRGAERIAYSAGRGALSTRPLAQLGAAHHAWRLPLSARPLAPLGAEYPAWRLPLSARPDAPLGAVYNVSPNP